MKAKVIFISEKEMLSTNGLYALASSSVSENRDTVFVRLDDVINFIQTSQNACAEEMIKAQERVVSDEQKTEVPLTSQYHAEWRTYNYILSELKKYQNK